MPKRAAGRGRGPGTSPWNRDFWAFAEATAHDPVAPHEWPRVWQLSVFHGGVPGGPAPARRDG